jgi:hypothetical protein
VAAAIASATVRLAASRDAKAAWAAVSANAAALCAARVARAASARAMAAARRARAASAAAAPA